MKYLHYSSEQYFFDRILYELVFAIRCAGKTIVYFPQLSGGYCMAGCLLNKDSTGILWIALTVLFAFILYQCIFLLKGLLIAFKTKRNFWWMPLFMLCILYTCVLPLMLFVGLLHQAALYCTIAYADPLTWLLAIIACCYLYSKYAFLNDSAPKFALSMYKLGNNIVKRI